MRYEVRSTADELTQLALWLEMISRMDQIPDDDQIELIASRVESCLNKVKVLRAFGGRGAFEESPDQEAT